MLCFSVVNVSRAGRAFIAPGAMWTVWLLDRLNCAVMVRVCRAMIPSVIAAFAIKDGKAMIKLRRVQLT